MGLESFEILKSVEVPPKDVRIFGYYQEYGIVGMMDCGGSNLVRINEQIPGIVRLVATSRIDHPDVKAREKAKKFRVPLVELDFRQYEEENGVFPGDYLRALNPELHGKIKSRLSPKEIVQVRSDVCSRFMDMIYEKMDKEGIPRGIPVFAAGFMALLSKEFINNFFILNVHPGDLTKYSLDNIQRSERTIVGDGWIPPAKAISAGHDALYSSMHLMVPEMDAGPVFMRGYPLPINYNGLMGRVDIRDKEKLKAVGEAAQEALKHLGDHVIAGATFTDIFRQNWGSHASGVMAYRFNGDWHLAPNGITIDDYVHNNPASVFIRDEKFIGDIIQKFYEEVDRIAGRR